MLVEKHTYFVTFSHFKSYMRKMNGEMIFCSVQIISRVESKVGDIRDTKTSKFVARRFAS